MALTLTSFAITPVMTAKAAATTPESGNIYYIKNKNSGLKQTNVPQRVGAHQRETGREAGFFCGIMLV